MARMEAAMVEIDEEAEAGNRDQRREPVQGQYECKWSRTQPAKQALAQDRPAGFFGRAVPLAALIELGKDGPPFEALRLLPFVKLVEMFLFGLDIAGKLDLVCAELH